MKSMTYELKNTEAIGWIGSFFSALTVLFQISVTNDDYFIEISMGELCETKS